MPDSNADLSGTVRIPKRYADRTRRVLDALNDTDVARLIGPTKASKLIARAVEIGIPRVLEHMEQELGLVAETHNALDEDAPSPASHNDDVLFGQETP